MEIKKVGVIGCGQMGGGIARVCAQSGYPVAVSEANETLLEKGLNALKTSLEKDVSKQRITRQDADALLARISGTTRTEDLTGCDLVVEAVIENLDLKKKIFTNLDKTCPPQTILATNTSSLSVSEIASAAGRKDKILGMHFFNPVPVMMLLEIVKTSATSEETLDTCKAFGKSLGKTVITAPDTAGFIVNRLMVPQILNAINMFASGSATAEDIDNGMKLGLNHPLGPLSLADLIGLDTVLAMAESMHDNFNENQYVPPPLLKKMVAEGRLGRKTGQGFYKYN
jgi:3-hydroxybutyryl-CoA dehydrogenase